MTRRSTLPPELRRRRRRACWVAWVVVVVVTAATSVAAVLMDGNWEWASPENRLWLVLGAFLIVGMTTALTIWATRRYVRAPRRAIRSQDDGGGPLGVVVAEGFLSRLAFGMISFSLPLYAHRLGMSIENIGVLLATNTAVAILLKPLMGTVIDRIGVRTSYIVAVGLRTVVVLSLVFAQTPLHLFLVRGLHGVAISLRDPSSSTILAALGGKKAVAQRFSWYQTVKTVAGSAGGFSAGILLTALAGDHAFVFAVSAILSGLPMLLVLFGLRGPQVAGLTRKPEKKTPVPVELRRLIRPYALLGAAMNGTAYLMANLLPLLSVSYMGLSEAAASSLYVFSTMMSFSGPLWGWLADRVSLKLVLGVRAIGNVFSSLVWLLFPSYAGLVVGKVADDAGKAAFRPAWGAVMAKVAALDPVRRTRTLAIMSTAEDAGEFGAPILAGFIWTTFGLPAVLVVRLCAGTATEIYSWWLASHMKIDDDRSGQESDTEAPIQPRRSA